MQGVHVLFKLFVIIYVYWCSNITSISAKRQAN